MNDISYRDWLKKITISLKKKIITIKSTLLWITKIETFKVDGWCLIYNNLLFDWLKSRWGFSVNKKYFQIIKWKQNKIKFHCNI